MNRIVTIRIGYEQKLEVLQGIRSLDHAIVKWEAEK